MKKELIAVIDCNNFFVSCERVFRPDLEGKPVAVLSSNDGCIVARSQEVKEMAIPMGIPVFQIKDIVKDNNIKLFSSNFALYRDFSRRVFTIIKADFTVFEQYSIDEAFIYLGEIDEEIARIKVIELKKKIYQFTGIPVSIGIGHTKTQAKYASTQAKRDSSGVFICNEVWWQKNAQAVVIGDIWGVGRQLRERYQKNGIYTVEDLRRSPTQTLQTISGVVGGRLQLELSSEVVYKVKPSHKLPQSIISSRSFGSPVTDKAVLLSALIHHLHNVVADLEKQKLVATNFSLYIEKKRQDGQKNYQTIPMPIDIPTRNITVLLRELYSIVDRNFTKSIYKKAGVLALGLMPEDYLPQTLFANVESITKISGNNDISTVQTLMYELQKKFKVGAITIGANTNETKWKSRQERCSLAYTTAWTQLPIVVANN